jgi:exonuclease III
MNQDFIIGHINVYHMDNKIHDISSLLLSEGQMLILGITETRLSEKHSHKSLQIPNYTLVRRDASQPGHTGIGAYLHHSIINSSKRRCDLESHFVECLWFEVRVHQCPPVLVGFLYRNPASRHDWYDNFLDMMDHIQSLNMNTILLGDFNIDLLTIQPHWKMIINMIGFEQLIKDPTRITKTSSTLLDHIYVNNLNIIKKTTVSDICMSDHKPIICVLTSKLPKQFNKGHSYIKHRNFRKFNELIFLHDLSFIDFSNVLSCNDANAAAECFMETFLPLIDKHAPVKRKRVKYSTIPSWMTNEIKIAMALRDKLKKDKLFTEYKKQRNKVCDLVRQAKRSLFQKLVSNETRNVSRLWTAMNEFTKKSRNCHTNKPIPFSPNEFNNHFISVSESLLNNVNVPNQQYEVSDQLKVFCKNRLSSDDSFTIPPIAVHEVGKLITQLNNKKSMDIYFLNASILKMSLPYIVHIITHIYNLSIYQNTFPSVFKKAKVISIPKSNDISDIDNFRPISILPILSKPLERYIHQHLTSYLENKNLLHPFQSGFRCKHSCQTALTRLCDTWLDAINSRLMIGTVFLDLRKAFDMVNHDILIKKLYCYFQNTNSLSLLSSYLSERSQVVSQNGCTSAPGIVKWGVPQGSILGPVLFCLFINDLPLAIRNEDTILDLFADDSTLHTKGKDITQIETSLQSGVIDVNGWCHNNNMLLHPKKSKSMLITTRQKHQRQPLNLNITLESITIEQVSEHRLLGVIIDEELTWKSHINCIAKKISRNLFLLNKLRPLVTVDGLKSFFSAHCMSHLNYASNIWFKTSDVHIKKLESLHKRGLKIMCMQNNLTTLEKCSLLDVLPLSKQFEYNIGILIFKIIHGDAPLYLNTFIQKPCIGNRLFNCKLPFPRIDIFKTSLAFAGSSIWNSFPANVKNCNSLYTFKHSLRKHLMA